MIDFHCHLDLYEDPRSVLRQALRRRCSVLAVTTTPLAWEGTQALVGSARGVQVAVGLHPELAATRYREIDRVCDLVSETPYVGEIGLDGSERHRSSLSIQRQTFESVLSACESNGGRIMTIHSRGAASLVLDHLAARPKSGIPVMHWFSGTQSELARAIDLGCWFSVGPAMLRGTKGRRLASLMPIDRVLTETDGPIARRWGRALMPWNVREAEVELGAIWNLSVSTVQRRLSRNLRNLVALKEHSNFAGQNLTDCLDCLGERLLS